jgi:uncharacterized protein
VRYWDSSALLPLLVREAATPAIRALLRQDPEVMTWWGTPVEAASALARLARDGMLPPDAHEAALARLARASEGWDEVVPTAAVRTEALRLLRVHPLRAADALQLAGAVVASEHQPATLPVVTLDQRLASAARLEGFGVLPR